MTAERGLDHARFARSLIATADGIQAAGPNPTQATNHPHGNPTSAPSAELRVVTGGGEVCTL